MLATSAIGILNSVSCNHTEKSKYYVMTYQIILFVSGYYSI